MFFLYIRIRDALCNAQVKQNKFFRTVKEFRFATSDDDSIPRLFQSLMTIRRLLLQNKEGIINFVKDCYDKMMMKNGKEDLLQKDWLCYLLDKKNNQKAHLAHLFSIIHSMNENPEEWFYQITEVPTVSFYYEQMIDFCKHKLKKTSSINLQLYFIDLQQMISHSHQHYSIAIKELIEKDTVEFIDQIKDSLICIVNTLLPDKRPSTISKEYKL